MDDALHPDSLNYHLEVACHETTKKELAAIRACFAEASQDNATASARIAELEKAGCWALAQAYAYGLGLQDSGLRTDEFAADLKEAHLVIDPESFPTNP